MRQGLPMAETSHTHRSCARIVELAAALVAAFVVTVRPLFSGNASPLNRNINVYLAAISVLLLVGLGWVLRKRVALRSPLVCAALLAFVATSVLTSVDAGYRFGALVRTIDIMAWALGAAMLAQVFGTPVRGRVLLAALIATLAVLAVYGIYQHFVELPDLRANLDEHLRRMVETGKVPAALIDTLRKRANTGDVWGRFVLANNFAGYLILLIPAAFASTWLALRRKSILSAIALALVSATSCWTLWLTRSKGGMLALFAALAGGGAWAIGRRLFGRRAAATAAVTLIAILLTAQKTDDDIARERLMSTPLGASMEVRLEYWKGAWAIFREHPLIGVGPGNFREHYIAHRTPEGSETKYAHNDFLEVAVEQGVVGLAAYLAIWIAWFASMRRERSVLPEQDASFSERRTLAIVVAVAGILSMAFAILPFVMSFETKMQWLAGTLIWLGVYATQTISTWRQADSPRERGPLRWAMAVGVVAFLAHSSIDFDFEVPGLTRTLAGVMAVGLALRVDGPRREARSIGSIGQTVVAAATVVPAALALAFILQPLAKMSIALEQAQAAAATAAGKSREAVDARKRGDLQAAERLNAESVKACDEQKARCRQAVAEWTGNAEPYMELANVESAEIRLAGKSDAREFRSLTDTVKRLRPQDPEPYMMMARVLEALALRAAQRSDEKTTRILREEAEREMTEAVKRYPTHPLLRQMHAETLERLDRNAEAVAEYELALRFAERTSEKELKFPPEEEARIRRKIEQLKR